MNRVTTSVMQSAGAIDKTIDREFDEQERNFKVVEQRIENLHRELKGYLDAVRKMTVAQHAIAETIDLFYDESDPLQKASQAYKDAMVSMDEEVRGELDHTYRATVMEPVGKLVGILPFINDAIKKRNKKLLDYDRAKSTVRKIVEKPSEDPSKLAKVRLVFTKAEQELAIIRNIYEPLNSQLIAEIPLLIHMQVEYLNPSFESLVKSQLAFNEGAYYRLEGAKKSFPGDPSKGLEGRVEMVLEQMRELSICKA